jgi:hypothetical protein
MGDIVDVSAVEEFVVVAYLIKWHQEWESTQNGRLAQLKMCLLRFYHVDHISHYLTIPGSGGG